MSKQYYVTLRSADYDIPANVPLKIMAITDLRGIVVLKPSTARRDSRYRISSYDILHDSRDRFIYVNDQLQEDDVTLHFFPRDLNDTVEVKDE